VIVAVMSGGETQSTLETFWRNVWLRGPMIFDATGDIATVAYAQPPTLLPFGRSYVISKDKIVVLPHFGYDPDFVSATIDQLLNDG
jgi:hypothetical protein